MPDDVFLVTQAQEKKDQFELKGQVLIEESDESIPYVTITVQDENGTVVTRQASDGIGVFSFSLSKSGSFDVVLSAVGYATMTKRVVIGETEKVTDLGKIGMKEGVELKEVIKSMPANSVKDIEVITNPSSKMEGRICFSQCRGQFSLDHVARERYQWGQTFRLNVTYRFGKMNMQVKKVRRGISNDDQRSDGGVQGGEGGQ